MKLTNPFKRTPKPAEPVEPAERAISIDQIFQQVQHVLMENMQAMYDMAATEQPHYGYLVNIYIDGGILYALFNNEGLLSRAAIEIGDNDMVTLGAPESVAQQFQPVSRNTFSIVRQADGRTRFFVVAATAIINRQGEIDSTKLFDDMIARAERTNFYPRLDFFHLGAVHPAFEFGSFDYVAREGFAYVGSGLFDDGHPLAEATIRAWDKDSAAWGASIEYYPAENSVEYLPLSAGLEVAVFTAGLNTRISLLPEQNAAAWFTSVLVERSMEKKKLEALKALFGDNEDGFNKFVAGLGAINEDVQDRGLIARATDEVASVETPVVETPVEVTAPVIELDDEAIQAITRQMETGVTAQFKQGISDVQATLAELAATITTLRADFDKRLAGLEREDSEKQREWVADLPARARDNVRVTYRPREQHAVEVAGTPPTDDVIAKKTLDRLPKVGAFS